MTRPNPACALCGQRGSWVGWDASVRGWRCVNHVGRPDTEEERERVRARAAAFRAEVREALGKEKA